MTSSIEYSIVVPTYRRPDALSECLESVCRLDYPKDRIEVIVIDNGGMEQTSVEAAQPYANRLQLRYVINRRNRGYGFSVNRGIVESTGRRVLLLNDDARPAANLLVECDRLLGSDPTIGCVGCRAIERGYARSGHGIGRIDESGEVVANFDIDCGAPIEVEHVYGFCYVFSREAIERAGLNDRTLLAKPYSSGDRIETDHCLSIRRSGLKVIYNPRMVATHLAKPRADIGERSLQWKRNAIRNTLYLYLKHYGVLGKSAAALRLTFLVDVGLLSALCRPSRANLGYLMNGLRARASAYGHYVGYLAGVHPNSVAAFRRELARREDGVARTPAG
jgi:GT2 family glycosyltransferase